MVFIILIFILILGLLIFSHEFGHFILAKRSGIKVDEFGFGLPPRIFGVKMGETVYSVNLLPIGGFVKIYGEEGEGENDSRSFSSKSTGTRLKIVASGVVMNLFLAMALFSIGHGIGLPTVIDENFQGDVKDAKIQITQIAPDSPAETAGIRVGDTIKKLKITPKKFSQNLTGQENGKLKITEADITEIKQLQVFISEYKGMEIILVLQRGDEIMEKTLVPRKIFPDGEGPIGIAMVKTGIISYPWHIAPIKGIETTFTMIGAIVSAFFAVLKNLVISGRIAADLTGPVGIAVLITQAAKLGFIYILQFTAFLSVNLAIINTIPFPALDGGRILFLIIERIRGRKAPVSLEKFVHTAGLAFLILLMILITFRDIGRLF